jgi:hypothetical protein
MQIVHNLQDSRQVDGLSSQSRQPTKGANEKTEVAHKREKSQKGTTKMPMNTDQ